MGSKHRPRSVGWRRRLIPSALEIDPPAAKPASLSTGVHRRTIVLVRAVAEAEVFLHGGGGGGTTVVHGEAGADHCGKLLSGNPIVYRNVASPVERCFAFLRHLRGTSVLDSFLQIIEPCGWPKRGISNRGRINLAGRVETSRAGTSPRSVPMGHSQGQLVSDQAAARGCAVPMFSPSAAVGRRELDPTQRSPGDRKRRCAAAAGLDLRSSREHATRATMGTAVQVQGSTMTLACFSGLASSANASLTPSRPTEPVTSGVISTLPSAMWCRLSANSCAV